MGASDSKPEEKKEEPEWVKNFFLGTSKKDPKKKEFIGMEFRCDLTHFKE